MEEKIYPSMVIRSQAEAIELLEKENQQLKHNRDKAIDKLYCWGEVLQPDFQKEMLNILKGDSDE